MKSSQSITIYIISAIKNLPQHNFYVAGGVLFTFNNG